MNAFATDMATAPAGAAEAAVREELLRVDNVSLSFGGVKASGVGRDGGDWSFEFYMETVNVSFPRQGHKIPKLGG